MITPSQLKEIFRDHRFRPLKTRGQHFLVAEHVQLRIIRELGIREGETIVEIGPGFGALTVDIAHIAERVIAVEKDEKICDIAKMIFVNEGLSNIELVNDDILQFPIESFVKAHHAKVVGNLPYYITTPIITYLIEKRKYFTTALIMVQKEVAGRILAHPGSKTYGSLTCYIQYYMAPTYVMTVSKQSFYPVPEVDSSLIRLEVRQSSPVAAMNEKFMFSVIRAAFGQRRKAIINSLSHKGALGFSKEELAHVMERCGIDKSVRPEHISLKDFADIANALWAAKKDV